MAVYSFKIKNYVGIVSIHMSSSRQELIKRRKDLMQNSSGLQFTQIKKTEVINLQR